MSNLMEGIFNRFLKNGVLKFLAKPKASILTMSTSKPILPRQKKWAKLPSWWNLYSHSQGFPIARILDLLAMHFHFGKVPSIAFTFY